MGLLEDFETLEKRQTDSIEYYLYQLVLKDKHPINIDIKTYEYAKDIEPRSIIQDRVYIIVRGDKILIGIHPVLKEIELNDFYLYLDLYKEQYPNENIRDIIDWPLWHLIYITYTHLYDEDFIYEISNDGRWATGKTKNYRVKLQPQPLSHTNAYEKYISGYKQQTIKIDYSK